MLGLGNSQILGKTAEVGIYRKWRYGYIQRQFLLNTVE